jgi:hypothetical protein
MEIKSTQIGINRNSVILKPQFLEYNNCDKPESNCFYRILISSKPFSLTLISLTEAFTNTNLQFKKLYYKSLINDKADCYYLNKTLFSNEELISNSNSNINKNPDRLIIKSYSPSDQLSLVILKDPKKLNTTDDDDSRIEMTFLDEINFRLNFTEAIDKYICLENIKSDQISYSLFVYKESDSENIQRYNYLTNGNFNKS